MAYNMSKAAIEHMARTAAIEVAEHRIRINLVQPGWTDTPGELKFASRETLDTAGAKIPLGRLGTAEEMADGILFLCDPEQHVHHRRGPARRRRHQPPLVGQPRLGRAGAKDLGFRL